MPEWRTYGTYRILLNMRLYIKLQIKVCLNRNPEAKEDLLCSPGRDLIVLFKRMHPFPFSGWLLWKRGREMSNPGR